MIAAHVENLLFLLLVAVAVLFQFLAKTAGKANKNQTKRTSTSQTPPQIPRAPKGSEDDPIRKLLEALGQPPTSRPPPVVAPRTDVPPHPLAPVQPPQSPLAQLRREKSRKRDVTTIEKPVTFPRAARILPPKATAAPSFETHKGPSLIATTGTEATQTGVKTEKFSTGITTLLASASGLRDAIILREILGPPRGLQRIDSL